MRTSGSTLLLLAAAGAVLLVGDSSAVEATCPGTLVPTSGQEAMKSFEADRYLGLWYEIRRAAPENLENGGKCITTEYTLSGINNVTVHNRMFIDGTFKDKIGWAKLDDPATGKFAVNFEEKDSDSFLVLDTDYTGYSIVWGCRKDADGNEVETTWILSRSASLNEEQETTVKNQLESLGVAWDQLNPTSQEPEDCIVTKCDRPAVDDFDANEYLGVWYEIARFGQTEFEDGGQCTTVEYALSGINNVTIHNRMYTTADGTFVDKFSWADLDNPNSKEGKFTVHLQEDARYWVLDTDYETYSIVWACREHEESNITESSWILSRTAQLTEEQERKVNDKLEALGLRRSRYTDTPQDAEQCVPNSNTCDKSVVTQFEISKYLGTWYEIARFGQAPLEEGGQCITAKYIQVDVNNVTVHNRMFSKAAGSFKDISGWAELDYPDTEEAKLTVHFPSIQATAPYWVLDTDYENYSIVWSCSESTYDTSEITGTSWILSRHPELTPEQVEQVTEKLDAKGLSWSSYETISQDTQKCVASGSAACNKPAVTEFDIYKYLGTWYEIARFGEAPMEEGGQCITAEYALVSKDNVTVHNRIFSKAARAFKDINGWAQLDDPDNEEAKLTVHFPSESVTTPYWVLDTDYANYSIVWACSKSTDDTSEITETSWVLSRTRVMPVEVQQLVTAKLQELGLPGSQFTETPQDPKGCKVKGTKGGAAAAGPAVALTLITVIALLFSPW